VLTSLLTLYAIARVWNLAFWRGPNPAMPAPGDTTHDLPALSGAMLPRLMVAPTLVLVALGMALTVVAGPLFAISDQAAGDLIERGGYVRAVLPEAP